MMVLPTVRSYILEARWCVMTEDEMTKCEALQKAIEERTELQNNDYIEMSYDQLPELQCIKANDK